jgi:hypothetical protein
MRCSRWPVILGRQRASRVAVMFCLNDRAGRRLVRRLHRHALRHERERRDSVARLALTAVCFLPARSTTSPRPRCGSTAHRKRIFAAWTIATLFALLAASKYGCFLSERELR